MRKRWNLILLAGLVHAFWLGPVHAQQAPSSQDAPAPLLEQVAGVNRSLARLVSLLEHSLVNQRVDLLLKRIELKERRMAPMERALRSAESTVHGMQSDVDSLREMQLDLERVIDEQIREGTDDSNSPARVEVNQIRRAVKLQTGRLEQERARVRRLEDDLAEGREEIEDLDALLLELLE